jgi:hypothetical protein
MSKQKHQKVQHTVIHPSLEKAGAIALAAVSVLVTFETLIEHHPKLGRHSEESKKPLMSEVFVARAETKGETARLPEEFDIGLQTPHIAGL